MSCPCPSSVQLLLPVTVAVAKACCCFCCSCCYCCCGLFPRSDQRRLVLSSLPSFLPFLPSFLPSHPILPFFHFFHFPPLALVPFLPLLSCRIPVSVPTSSITAGYQSPGRVQSAEVLALGLFDSRGLASCSVVVSASVSDSVGCLAQSHALIPGPIYSPSSRLARRLLASTTHAFSRRFPGSLLPARSLAASTSTSVHQRILRESLHHTP